MKEKFQRSFLIKFVKIFLLYNNRIQTYSSFNGDILLKNDTKISRMAHFTPPTRFGGAKNGPNLCNFSPKNDIERSKMVVFGAIKLVTHCWTDLMSCCYIQKFLWGQKASKQAKISKNRPKQPFLRYFEAFFRRIWTQRSNF